jgi:hypothetical protein
MLVLEHLSRLKKKNNNEILTITKNLITLEIVAKFDILFNKSVSDIDTNIHLHKISVMPLLVELGVHRIYNWSYAQINFPTNFASQRFSIRILVCV